MTISESVEYAKTLMSTIDDVGQIHSNHASILLDLSYKSIDNLLNIIYWYDRNQQRLIKTLVKQNKELKSGR